MKKISNLKKLILDILFPIFCLGCNREGSYLCDDCQATMEISPCRYCLCSKPKRIINKGKCQSCVSKKLDGLYSAVSRQTLLAKELIQKFKCPPFAKELAYPLSSLIIEHFLLLDNQPDFSDFVLTPIPIERSHLRWRDYSPAEEIAKKLADYFKVSLLNNVLIKIKSTPDEIELSDTQKEEDLKGAFKVKNSEKIQERKILLIDDVYTIGIVMEECARILKESGAKEVWGITVAR